jgi:hypothetical protein
VECVAKARVGDVVEGMMWDDGDVSSTGRRRQRGRCGQSRIRTLGKKDERDLQ